MRDIIELKLYLTIEEKIDFLKKKGYEIKEQTVSMGTPVYHNDMEYEDVKVLTVLKDGKEMSQDRPSGYGFGREDWIDNVFKEEIQLKIKNLLFN